MWLNPIWILKATNGRKQNRSIQLNTKKSSSPSSIMAWSLMCDLTWPCHFDSVIILSIQNGTAIRWPGSSSKRLPRRSEEKAWVDSYYLELFLMCCDSCIVCLLITLTGKRNLGSSEMSYATGISSPLKPEWKRWQKCGGRRIATSVRQKEIDNTFGNETFWGHSPSKATPRPIQLSIHSKLAG